MTKNPLEAIQARADAATEGPWEVDRNYPFSSELVGIYATNRKDYVIKADDQDEYPTQGTDAVFIAHAREDVPALVAALRAVEAVLVDWDKFAKQCLVRADPSSGLHFTEQDRQREMAENCATDTLRIRTVIREALGG